MGENNTDFNWFLDQIGAQLGKKDLANDPVALMLAKLVDEVLCRLDFPTPEGKTIEQAVSALLFFYVPSLIREITDLREKVKDLERRIPPYRSN